MYRVLKHAQSGEILLPKVKWCASYWCHFRGLQFRQSLPDDEGLLFVTGRESIVATSIHMFNVFFPISVIWIDKSGVVVDKVLAKPWRPAYAPAKPAQYYLEANPYLLDRIALDDLLLFDEVAQV
jgi:uncharacterized membrane protein (UPF0127 family)